MDHILVAGGAGYIGSHTVRALTTAGYKVTVVDNLVHGHEWAIDSEVQLVQQNMGDPVAMEQLFNKYQFDAVINFAGYINVGESVSDPLKYYQNNVGASSTCATYGVIDQLPITESESQLPINPYGQSKLMYEKILDDCEQAWDLRSVCLRYFNACGASSDAVIGEAHDPETHLIPLVLEAANGKREHIIINGDDYPTPDGTCIRDYIHVDDLADAHVKAVQRLLGGGDSLKCNLGTGDGLSIMQIVEAARRVTGKDISLKYGPRREGDPPQLVADPTLANNELNWTPLHSDIDYIIQTAWNWMKKEN